MGTGARPTLKLFLFDWDSGNLRTSTARPYGEVVLSLWLDVGGYGIRPYEQLIWGGKGERKNTPPFVD